MNMMKKIALTLCVVPMLAFAGCGEAEAVKDMNAAIDKLCACEDLKCQMDALKERMEVGKKYEGTKVAESDNKKLEAATERMTKCMTENSAKFTKAALEAATKGTKAAAEATKTK